MMPDYKTFGPLNGSPKDEDIILSIEEYETIRLIDLDGLEQQECAERMGVARSTVQRMYSQAKGKLADSLVNGKRLKIQGGDYTLCEMDGEFCPDCSRRRHRHGPGAGRGQGRGPGQGMGPGRGQGRGPGRGMGPGQGQTRD